MSRTKSEFVGWTAPESGLTVEYSPELMEEIRSYALQGVQRSRAEYETGGILFGVHSNHIVRILAWRAIECEHASSPAFVLSQRDRLAMARLLHNTEADLQLRDLEPVGWFVSHSESGVRLTETDLKIYNTYFPQNWQLSLVVQPFRVSATKAGFFTRDSSGGVNSDKSDREFTIPLYAALEPEARDLPRHAALLEEGAPPPFVQSPAPSYALRKDQAGAAPGFKVTFRHWMWAVPAVLAIIAGGLLLELPSSKKAPASFGLQVSGQAGQLRLHWDKDSKAIRNATRGSIEITDGNSVIPITLDRNTLRTGSFVYMRKSGDVELRMTVYPALGSPAEESVRFVGQSGTALPGPADADLRRQRDSLASQVGRLQQDLQREYVRNRNLEDTVHALENRLQLQEEQKPTQPRKK